MTEDFVVRHDYSVALPTEYAIQAVFQGGKNNILWWDHTKGEVAVDERITYGQLKSRIIEALIGGYSVEYNDTPGNSLISGWFAFVSPKEQERVGALMKEIIRNEDRRD